MTRIHVSTPLTSDTEISIEGSAANHIGRVLRLKPGNTLTLFNGAGGEYAATLSAIERQSVRIQVGPFSAIERESPLPVTLAQGISRGERMDYTLQKSVELGVTHIVPLFTARCGVKLDAKRASKRLQHWQGVIISACEQCGRNRIPELLPPASLHTWLDQQQDEALRLVLHPQATVTLSQLERPTGKVSLLIGPEGGLSENEIEITAQCGYQGIRLGPRVLRTETAGVTALAALQTHWGDLG